MSRCSRTCRSLRAALLVALAGAAQAGEAVAVLVSEGGTEAAASSPAPPARLLAWPTGRRVLSLRLGADRRGEGAGPSSALPRRGALGLPVHLRRDRAHPGIPGRRPLRRGRAPSGGRGRGHLRALELSALRLREPAHPWRRARGRVDPVFRDVRDDGLRARDHRRAAGACGREPGRAPATPSTNCRPAVIH